MSPFNGAPPPDVTGRQFLERKLRELFTFIDNRLPKVMGVGFVLVLFDFGKDPAFVFGSNATSGTMVSALESTLQAMKPQLLQRRTTAELEHEAMELRAEVASLKVLLVDLVEAATLDEHEGNSDRTRVHQLLRDERTRKLLVVQVKQ